MACQHCEMRDSFIRHLLKRIDDMEDERKRSFLSTFLLEKKATLDRGEKILSTFLLEKKATLDRGEKIDPPICVPQKKRSIQVPILDE